MNPLLTLYLSEVALCSPYTFRTKTLLNKLELPSKMLAYETYLICICAMAHATECITRGQFDDIGIFFRFKFEEYIPLVMIFDKNIKETFSTT